MVSGGFHVMQYPHPYRGQTNCVGTQEFQSVRPSCLRTRIQAFIRGEDAPDHSIRAAVRICEQCPTRARCAEQALTGGTSLDGHMTAPATGVVQAGVVCRGDRATARVLAAIAGVPVPTYRKKRPRNRAPEHCVSCKRKMVPWTRYDVPEGFVMHRGRGHCVNCRSAYNALLEAEREAKGEQVKIRKPAPLRGRQRTPSHCRDCQRPMIPSSYPPREGYVKNHAGGRCATCYRRASREQERAREAA